MNFLRSMNYLRSWGLRTSTILALLILASGTAFSQGPRPDQPDLTIDAATRSAVVDQLATILNHDYIFPETAAKMDKALHDHLKNKDYDSIVSAEAFAQKLTADLSDIAHDKHLHVIYSARPLPPESHDAGPSPEDLAGMREFVRTQNCGFEKEERMAGNVGYLDLRGFNPADMCAETAGAAMTLLAHSDALVIDLRHNGGGDPAMVALISSYLFNSEPVHLNDLYWRADESTHQWWTLPYVPGQRFGADKPVYVLTSKRTFSAAEEFTYNLKNLKRATIVGETTGGGANPGGGRRLGDHFGAFIPTGRAINPITKTNWEGTGIKPDVEVPADDALKVAHLAAMKKIMEGVKDPERRGFIQKEIDRLQTESDTKK
jgi:hypothetical protein